MHATESSAIIGRSGRLRVDPEFFADVTVTDVRTVYGRTDYLVRPVAGSGSAWVSAERVELTDPAPVGRRAGRCRSCGARDPFEFNPECPECDARKAESVADDYRLRAEREDV